MLQSNVSDCGKYLILSISHTVRDNMLYYADLKPDEPITSKMDFKPIVDKFEADYQDLLFVLYIKKKY